MNLANLCSSLQVQVRAIWHTFLTSCHNHTEFLSCSFAQVPLAKSARLRAARACIIVDQAGSGSLWRTVIPACELRRSLQNVGGVNGDANALRNKHKRPRHASTHGLHNVRCAATQITRSLLPVRAATLTSAGHRVTSFEEISHG